MPDQDYRLIPLCRRDGSVGAHAVVDAADYEFATGYRWSLSGDGYAARKPYSGPMTYLHRELLRLSPGDPREVDHIDLDHLNNRRSNLRRVTHAENLQNQPSRAGSSSFRGVAWNRALKHWQASTTLNYRTHFLGLHDREIDAARAAEAFRRKHMTHAIPDYALDPLPGCNCRACR